MQNEPELFQRRIARARKSLLGTGLVVLFLGFFPLMNSIDNPRVAMLRGPDVLRLFAIGWCFGIGATLLCGGSMLSRLIQRFKSL
jgi:hypothetical protein